MQTQCSWSVVGREGGILAEMHIAWILSADGFGGRTKNPNGDTEAKI